MIQTYRCVGVQVSTHVLDFQLQLLLCTVAGTLAFLLAPIETWFMPIESYLEREMLQKVSCAIGPVRLCPRSSINPHTNRRRLGPWRMLRSNLIYISLCKAFLTSCPYRQSIGQCRRLGLNGVFRDGRGVSPLQRRDCVEGRATADSLREVES